MAAGRKRVFRFRPLAADDKGMHVFVSAILAALTAASPAPAASAAPATLGGVTLGETAAQLVAQRGEPLLAQGAAAIQIWMYLSPGGGSMEMVAVKNGRVTGAAFMGHRTTPPAQDEDISALGVHLGGDAAAIPAAGKDDSPILSAGVKYTFRPSKDGKTVISISAALTDDAAAALPPAGDMPVLHDGSSPAQAVVLRAATTQLAQIFEGGYMAGHDFCNPGGKWKLIGRSVEQDGSRAYDVLNAGCSNNDQTKKIYFDISN
jgi:hypothetical protein